MNILMINKFYYIKGGSETYYFSLKAMLEENGHKVIPFSMKDEKNFDTEYAEYFVDHVEYNQKHSLSAQVRLGAKLIYSCEAKRKLEELLQKEQIDVAHLHIFQHQISLSILRVLKKHNIPIVYTAHDLQMLCPNYQMLQHGHVCELCKGGHYLQCIRHTCVKASIAKSALATLDAYVHSALHSYDAIDLILTPSRFYKEKFLEFGIAEQRVLHLPNFLNDTSLPIESDTQQAYYLYFGRLSHEKGIPTLISAFEQLSAKLFIVGTGPLYQELEELIKLKQLENIKLLGFQQGKALATIIGHAKAVILPSEWYENGPYTAIESLQAGRPILGADIGGIPELIIENENGFIFKPGNIASLIAAVTKMERLPETAYAAFVERSKSIFKAQYHGQAHYERLMNLYEQLIQHKNHS